MTSACHSGKTATRWFVMVKFEKYSKITHTQNKESEAMFIKLTFMTPLGSHTKAIKISRIQEVSRVKENHDSSGCFVKISNYKEVKLVRESFTAIFGEIQPEKKPDDFVLTDEEKEVVLLARSIQKR